MGEFGGSGARISPKAPILQTMRIINCRPGTLPNVSQSSRNHRIRQFRCAIAFKQRRCFTYCRVNLKITGTRYS